MGNDIRIKKTVLNKTQLDKVVDRSFTTFTKPVPVVNGDAVADFFKSYEELFYLIPANDDVNSHKYLVTRSSEVANFDTNTEEIQPLLDEITYLREQILQANQRILELETNTN